MSDQAGLFKFHGCSFHEGDYVIDGVRFEMSRFGPFLLGKSGQILDTQPTRRWLEAVTWWSQQGRRTESDGETCIYDKPKEPTIVHIVGRHHAVVPEGQDPEDVKRKWLAKL